MKLTKISLVAALLIGSSAFAIDNVKVSGDAKLFYSTDDSGDGFFEKDKAMGQASLGLGLSADLDKNVKANVHLTALSTLGLEGQLVNNVWETTNGTTDSYWFDQAYLSAKVEKTTLNVGRMMLDTPLVYSETWSVAANSFEAAVLINSDLPDTTIVAAYVGASNGANEKGAGGVIAPFNANGTSNFSQFYQGAYAVGLINNSFKPLKAQAWYYNASHVATAYWIEGDLELNGILAGAQYTSTDLEGQDAGTAGALMVGYDLKDVATFKVAYSKVSSDNAAASNLSGSGSSKLYTAGWWTTLVNGIDTTAYSASVESSIKNIADLGLYVTKAEQGSNDAGEATLAVSKSFGNLDTSVAYIYTNGFTTDDVNTLQVYLTYNY